MIVEILLVHLAAIVSPGPNVLLVSHTAASDSRRSGMWAAAGIASAAAVWAAAAAIGLGLLLERVAGLDDALRVLGGLYLVFLGLRIGLSGARDGAAAHVSQRAAARLWWWRGLATNLSNPKAAVFYLSIFATLIPAGASLSTRVAAVVAIGVNSLVWHELLAVGLSSPRPRALYQRARPWINAVAGALMVGFGVALALEAR